MAGALLLVLVAFVVRGTLIVLTESTRSSIDGSKESKKIIADSTINSTVQKNQLTDGSVLASSYLTTNQFEAFDSTSKIIVKDESAVNTMQNVLLTTPSLSSAPFKASLFPTLTNNDQVTSLMSSPSLSNLSPVRNNSGDSKEILTEDKMLAFEDYEYYGDYDAFFKKHYGDALEYLLSSSLYLKSQALLGFSSEISSSPDFFAVTATPLIQTIDDISISSSLNSDEIIPTDNAPTSLLVEASTHEYFTESASDDLANVFEWSKDDILESLLTVTDDEYLQSHRSVRSVSTSLKPQDDSSSLVILSSVIIRPDNISSVSSADIHPTSIKVVDYQHSSSTLQESLLVNIPSSVTTSLPPSSVLVSSQSFEESEYLSPFKSTDPLSNKPHLNLSSINVGFLVTPSPTPSVVSSGLSRTPFSNRGAQNKKQNIEEIITGLKHLLGSNVHVAHTYSEPVLLESSSPTLLNVTRINDRGPPKEGETTTIHTLASRVVFSTASQVNSHIGILELSKDTSTQVKPDESKTFSSGEEVKYTAFTTTNSFINSVTSEMSILITPSSKSSLSTPVSSQEQTQSVSDSVPTGPITEWVPVYLQPFEPPPSTTTRFTSVLSTRSSTASTSVNVPPVKTIISRPGVALSASSPSRKSHYPRPPVPMNELPPLPPIEADFRPIDPGAGGSQPPLFPSQSNEKVPEPVLAENVKNAFDVTLTATGFMGEEGPKQPETTTRSLTGRPFVVPVDIDDVNIGPRAPERPIISAPGTSGDQSVFIDGRRTYYHLNPTLALGNDEKDKSTKILGVGGNVQDPNKSPAPPPPPFRPSPTKRPSRPQQPHAANKPPRTRNTTPLIRIDTCIVGDESACDAEHHEVCRTEAGVSSCNCRPGFARSISQTTCSPVVALLVYVRLDRYNEERLSFHPQFEDRESSESKALEREAVMAMDSAFRMTSLATLYNGVIFNKFYALGGKLAINVTLYLQENLASKNPTIKQRVSKDLVNLLRQREQNLGQSHLFVDPQFSPVPGVQDLNECSDPELNDCSVNARCDNNFGGFKCTCHAGFNDKYPSDKVRSGRICSACTSEYCNQRGECVLKNGQQECVCKGSYIGSRCEIDGEVLGVALGASLAALLIIILTLVCLCMWSRRWKKDHHKPELSLYQPPSYTFGNKPSSMVPTLPPPPTHSSLMDDRMNWGPAADSFGNYYTQTEPATHGKNHPVSATNSSLVGPPAASKYLQSHLSRSRTSLIDTDGEVPAEDGSRFHVPRPKPRSVYNQQQNIYYDLDYGSPYDNYGGGSTYHGNNYSAYPMQNMRPYYS